VSVNAGCVVVGTDGSPSAERAVAWAASTVQREGGHLVLVQVVAPDSPDKPVSGTDGAAAAEIAAGALARRAEELVGSAGGARVVVAADIANAIVGVAEEEHADVVVVGNAGMGGRKEFLLGNVPNRVSHLARCTVVIVNTNGDGERGRAGCCGQADRAVNDLAPRADLLVGRAAKIVRVLATHGLGELFSGSRAHASEAENEERAVRLRLAFEELGPTFCKLGQILSTRPDLLPLEFVTELATLQDHVPAMSQADVVSVMEQELGVPWEDVFESIEADPLAAGTIAQVHRARLASGERVVVKVQRPEARAEIMRDVALLERFADKAAEHPAMARVVDAKAIVEHLSSSLSRELDFRQEAANIERMRSILETYPRLDVPGVHAELSTERLLVMEEICGGPISEAPAGPDRKEAARQLIESYYRQILIEGFFHADPHPGNLMWSDGTVYFLDCGMVGEVTPSLREDVMVLLLAFWQEDAAFLADMALSLAEGAPVGSFEPEQFRSDMAELVARHRHLPMREIQLGPILQEMTQIALRHEVPLPASLVLMTKALAQVQLATAELDPDLDPFAVAGSFIARTTLRRAQDSIEPQRMLYELQKLRVRATRLVEALERLVGVREGPKLQLQVRGIERLETSVRRAGRLVSVALVAAAAMIATGVTAASASAPSWVSRTFGAASSVLVLLVVLDVIRLGHRPP
jgi:predicted unusual protein kinase regulating ubiquinone biosynthesis (AarF/ABC1/UbiB family)/nucleotide-binding universal stress UspA family protein